jgi:hypothetical protein
MGIVLGVVLFFIVVWILLAASALLEYRLGGWNSKDDATSDPLAPQKASWE